jgi:hypothetical protein
MKVRPFFLVAADKQFEWHRSSSTFLSLSFVVKGRLIWINFAKGTGIRDTFAKPKVSHEGSKK